MEKEEKEILVLLEMARSHFFEDNTENQYKNHYISKEDYQLRMDKIKIANIRRENFLFDNSDLKDDEKIIFNKTRIPDDIAKGFGSNAEKMNSILLHLSKFKCTRYQAFMYMLVNYFPTLFSLFPQNMNDSGHWFNKSKDGENYLSIVWGNDDKPLVLKEKYPGQFVLSTPDELTHYIVEEKFARDFSVYSSATSIISIILNKTSNAVSDDDFLVYIAYMRDMMIESIKRVSKSMVAEIRNRGNYGTYLSFLLNDDVI